MRFLLTLLAVLGCVAAVYSVGLDNGFVWLDHFEIVEGALIVDSLDGVLALFWDDRNFAGYHRPIYNLLHSLDRALFGLDPLGFQLSSRLLHLSNVALVLWLARRLGWPLPWAALLALLFGLHPLNTACAGLIHAKADLFVFTAMAGSLALFLGRGPERLPAGALLRALSLGCFALALLTKEIAFCLPIGASLWLVAERRAGRSTRAETSWVVGVWLLALAAGLFRLAATEPHYSSPLALPERMLTFALVYVDDLRRLALPLDLAEADTVTRFGALSGAEQMQGLAAFALAGAAQVWLAWRAPWSRKWIALGNLALLPVAQIVPILHFRADRFLYLPSLAFLGAGLEAVRRALAAAPSRVRWSAALLPLVAGSYALRDVPRLRQFESDETLFGAELRRRGDYLEGLSHLARHLDRTARAPQATPLYALCFEPHPDLVSFFDGERTLLAYSANLIAVGRPAEALALLDRFAQGVQSPVVQDELDYNRAVALEQLGRSAEALPLLADYARTHPADAGCAFLLGKVALGLGQRAQALAAFERYLSLVPDAPERAALERVLSEPPPE